MQGKTCKLVRSLCNDWVCKLRLIETFRPQDYEALSRLSQPWMMNHACSMWLPALLLHGNANYKSLFSLLTTCNDLIRIHGRWSCSSSGRASRVIIRSVPDCISPSSYSSSRMHYVRSQLFHLHREIIFTNTKKVIRLIVWRSSTILSSYRETKLTLWANSCEVNL